MITNVIVRTNERTNEHTNGRTERRKLFTPRQTSYAEDIIKENVYMVWSLNSLFNSLCAIFAAILRLRIFQQSLKVRYRMR